jgi:hypothetical protein
MSKLGMMSGAAAIAMIAAVAWNYRPAHASDPLLEKAQSEFAIKARDALIQRRMAQMSITSEVAMAPVAPATSSTVPVIPDTVAVATEASSAPERTYVVASLEPVAPPANSFAKSPDTSVPSQLPVVDAAKADPSEVPASEPVAPPVQPEVAATEEKPAVEIKTEAPVDPKIEARVEAEAAPAAEAPIAEIQAAPIVIAEPAPKAVVAEAPVSPIATPMTTQLETPAADPVVKPIQTPRPAVTVMQTQLERETAWSDQSLKPAKPAAIVASPAPVQATTPVQTYAPVQTKTSVIAPTVAAPQAPVKVARRPAHEPCPARVTANNDHGYQNRAPREGYQARIHREYGIPKEVIRSGMSALRARDPQLAAMIARYM